MRSYNVLLIGEGVLRSQIEKSKFIKKIFCASDKINDAEIKFVTFKELAHMCKTLEIDIAIIEEERLIKQGLADFLKSSHINCIAPNIKWVDTCSSTLGMKQLLNRYNITTPLVLTYPKEFPLFVKADGVCEIANSIEEIVNIKQKIFDFSPIIAKTLFLEEYLQGKEVEILFLFDGKNLISLTRISEEQNLVEQINEFKIKLETLLCSEKMEFIGFITSKFIYSNNRLYNNGLGIEIPRLDIDFDLLYIFILALYQKLNEVNFNR